LIRWEKQKRKKGNKKSRPTVENQLQVGVGDLACQSVGRRERARKKRLS
jgi:hypothetical protein